MRKERVSATQLVDMITSQIGASGVEVSQGPCLWLAANHPCCAL